MSSRDAPQEGNASVIPGVSVRAAAPEAWPAMSQFMRRIVVAGETYSWERLACARPAPRTRQLGRVDARVRVGLDLERRLSLARAMRPEANLDRA